MGKGFFLAEAFAGDHAWPVGNAKVLVKDKKGTVLYHLETDKQGHTETISLYAPNKQESTNEIHREHPFSTYELEVNAKGYKRTIVRGLEIFDTITSILPIQLHQAIPGGTPEENTDIIDIPEPHGIDLPHEQEGPSDYSVSSMQSIPLANEVAIPEYITVHLGSPNAWASNVRVPFKDYIKNVASSEIYPTWEPDAIEANIYCQISFALNRIYTLWYRSRGKEFDITNSTAFDQYFVNGREIFENISQMVDDIFNRFIRREGRREPFFASYCNGTTSTCDGLSQWGSQYLAQQGYSPIEILRYYYPEDVQIVESTNFANKQGIYPGIPLKEGSSGEDVRRMQRYLNRISGNWFIPSISDPNGYFGYDTTSTVTDFQELFNISANGVIDKSTWYEIIRIYVAAKELAELTSEGERISIGTTPPTTTISLNARGENVVKLQFLLNYIALFYPTIPFVIQSGVFRDDTRKAVIEFQSQFGLTADGVVGPITWSKLYSVFHAIEGTKPPVKPAPGVLDIPAFPGIALQVGSSGSDVLLMQQYLNAIARSYPSIPTLTTDGAFGQLTQSAVMAFQRLFGLTVDGVIGQITWYKIVDVYNGLPSTETAPTYPGTALRRGSSGDNVRIMQNYLNAIRKQLPVIPSLTADGIFGAVTESAVKAFQQLFGLTSDGVIGPITWNKIVSVYLQLPSGTVQAYPGTALRVGSSGSNVTTLQELLNSIRIQYPSIPTLTVDGIFGPHVEQAVITFQRLFNLTADGVVGPVTWNMLVSVFNLTDMNELGLIDFPKIGEAFTSVDTGAQSLRGQSSDMIPWLLAFSLLKR